MFPVFPLYNLKIHQLKNFTMLITAGGGGNPLYGKENGLLIFNMDIKEIAYYQTEKIVYQFYLFKNEILLVFGENSYELLEFNIYTSQIMQKQVIFFEGNLKFFNGNIFYFLHKNYYCYKNEKIIIKKKRYKDCNIVYYNNYLIDICNPNSKYIKLDDDILIYDKLSFHLVSNNIKFYFKQLLSVNYSKREKILTATLSGNNINLYILKNGELELIYSACKNHQSITSAAYNDGKIYFVSIHGSIYYQRVYLTIRRYCMIFLSFLGYFYNNHYIALFLLNFLFK